MQVDVLDFTARHSRVTALRKPSHTIAKTSSGAFLLTAERRAPEVRTKWGPGGNDCGDHGYSHRRDRPTMAPGRAECQQSLPPRHAGRRHRNRRDEHDAVLHPSMLKHDGAGVRLPGSA